MPKRVPDTDSQKIRLIPEIMDSLAELYRLIVTGSLENNEPGMLEHVRNIDANTKLLMQDHPAMLDRIAGVEKRVASMEERHRLEDEIKSNRQKTVSGMTVAGFSIALSNIILLIVWLLGYGR